MTEPEVTETTEWGVRYDAFDGGQDEGLRMLLGTVDVMLPECPDIPGAPEGRAKSRAGWLNRIEGVRATVVHRTVRAVTERGAWAE